MATVQPDRIGAGFRTSDKNAVQRLLSVDLHQPLEGTYVEQLDYLVGARAVFRRPSWVMNAFARSATLGSTRSAM